MCVYDLVPRLHSPAFNAWCDKSWGVGLRRPRFLLASYPGLLWQLFLQPVEKKRAAFFSTAAKKSCERRPGYEASFLLMWQRKCGHNLPIVSHRSKNITSDPTCGTMCTTNIYSQNCRKLTQNSEFPSCTP